MFTILFVCGMDNDYGGRFISSDNAFLHLNASLYRIITVSLLLSDINSGKFAVAY